MKFITQGLRWVWGNRAVMCTTATARLLNFRAAASSLVVVIEEKTDDDSQNPEQRIPLIRFTSDKLTKKKNQSVKTRLCDCTKTLLHAQVCSNYEKKMFWIANTFKRKSKTSMANVFYENDKAISPHILNLQEVLTLLCVCQRVPSCLFVSSKEQNPLNILWNLNL